MHAVCVCGREVHGRDSATIAKARGYWRSLSNPAVDLRCHLWNWRGPSSHRLSDPCHLGWLLNLCLGFPIWKDDQDNNIDLIGGLGN